MTYGLRQLILEVNIKSQQEHLILDNLKKKTSKTLDLLTRFLEIIKKFKFIVYAENINFKKTKSILSPQFSQNFLSTRYSIIPPNMDACQHWAVYC
jgi:hypothetical protein